MKKIEIRSKSAIHGRGMFVTEDIRKGERIGFITGKLVKKIPKNRGEALSIPNWYGIGRSKWIDPEETSFRYLNHSCNPNAAIIGTKTIIALKNMKKDTELTIDYSMTDVDPLWEMTCLCKSKNCRGTLKAIQFLPKSVFKNHMPYIPRFFQRHYISNYIKTEVKLRDKNIRNG